MPMTKREQLEKLVHDMQAVADEADAKGDFTAEQRQSIVAMAADVKRLKEEIVSEAEASGTLADAKGFLAGLAGKSEPTAADKHDLTVDGLPMNPQGKTLGELFVGSDAYADFKGRYAGRDGVIPASSKGIQSAPFMADMGTKDLVTGASATSAGAAVFNDQYGSITDLIGERDLTVADIVTRGTTDSDTVEYVRVTGKTNAASPVVEASAASGTSGTKPESAMTLEVVSTTVKTVAHWMPMTKRAASDAPQVRTLVDNFLRYGLLEELEDQILNGSGSGENFTGILNTSGISTVGSAGTDIDAIVDAIRTIRNDRRRPNAVVFHPNDWYSTGFLLAKDSQQRYLIGDPRASVEQLNQIWGLQVVVTEAMTENTALVGEFRQAVLWEREGISLSVSDSHSDYFVRNLLAILAELRAAFGVLDPDAFCTVTAI